MPPILWLLSEFEENKNGLINIEPKSAANNRRLQEVISLGVTLRWIAQLVVNFFVCLYRF